MPEPELTGAVAHVDLHGVSRFIICSEACATASLTHLVLLLIGDCPKAKGPLGIRGTAVKASPKEKTYQ